MDLASRHSWVCGVQSYIQWNDITVTSLVTQTDTSLTFSVIQIWTAPTALQHTGLLYPSHYIWKRFIWLADKLIMATFNNISVSGVLHMHKLYWISNTGQRMLFIVVLFTQGDIITVLCTVIFIIDTSSLVIITVMYWPT